MKFIVDVQTGPLTFPDIIGDIWLDAIRDALEPLTRTGRVTLAVEPLREDG